MRQKKTLNNPTAPSIQPGLAKLPQSVPFSSIIRPAKLPSNCDGIEYERVYGIGIGRTYETQPPNTLDGIIRQAVFDEVPCTMSAELAMDGYANAPSVICTISRSQQNLAGGDSGKAIIKTLTITSKN